MGCLAKARAFNQARTMEVCPGPEQGILEIAIFLLLFFPWGERLA